MFIRSERLFLRPGWSEDAPDLTRVIGDESIVRNLAQVPWPYREEHARQWLERPATPGFPTLLITLPQEEGRIAGACGLHDEDGGPVLGYWIAKDLWGRGYATEAARAMLRVASALGHRRVESNHFVDNPASGRVLVKAGFRPLGRVGERFSIGRGGTVPALGFVAELDDPGDCDIGNDMKRAA